MDRRKTAATYLGPAIGDAEPWSGTPKGQGMFGRSQTQA